MYGVCENITYHFVRVLRRPSLIFQDQKNQVVNIVFIKHSMGKWKKHIEDEVSVEIWIMQGRFTSDDIFE